MPPFHISSIAPRLPRAKFLCRCVAGLVSTNLPRPFAVPPDLLSAVRQLLALSGRQAFLHAVLDRALDDPTPSVTRQRATILRCRARRWREAAVGQAILKQRYAIWMHCREAVKTAKVGYVQREYVADAMNVHRRR